MSISLFKVLVSSPANVQVTEAARSVWLIRFVSQDAKGQCPEIGQ